MEAPNPDALARLHPINRRRARDPKNYNTFPFLKKGLCRQAKQMVYNACGASMTARLVTCVFVAISIASGQTLAELEADAASLKAKGDAAGALALFQKASAVAPESARIQDEIGFLLAVLKRPSEAKPYFHRSLE